MRYAENHEASGEILRLLIQKMAGHPAAFNPLTYAVWYEFTVGINPALNQAVSNFLNEGKKLMMPLSKICMWSVLHSATWMRRG